MLEGKVEPIEFWGLTPDEARRRLVEKPKDLREKAMSLKEAVKKFVKNGDSLGIGGFVNSRQPVAIVHEIIRQGRKNLIISAQSLSLAGEFLAAAMIVDENHVSIKAAEIAWWAYEVIGLAPAFRYLAENGIIQVEDWTNYGMSARFKAGAMGIPCIPTRDSSLTDIERSHRGRTVTCPFTGKKIHLVPATHPNVGLIHVQDADVYGNCRIYGPMCTCPEIALASEKTIITCERFMDNYEIRKYPNRTNIPYFAVDAIANVPFGAYPGNCYGVHYFDMTHIRLFRGACEMFRAEGDKKPLEDYFDKYIFGVEDFDGFMDLIPWKQVREAIENEPGVYP
ncbi:MAG: CoA transferase subunit A [Candidatus Freyarchaeota archaeon]